MKRPHDEQQPRSVASALDARIRAACEPEPASLARVKARLREAPGPAASPWRRAGGPRLAASAVGLVLVLAVLVVRPWTMRPWTTPPIDELPAVAAATEPIVISNTRGFVTVTTGDSQWIVLPGDTR